MLYAKFSPHVNWSINKACLGGGTYDQIVDHLDQEIQVNGLETGRKITVPTMAIITTTVTYQTQPENAEREQIICLAKN